MDLYHFRLHSLFLATLGCCNGRMLLTDKTNGVVGKNVTFQTASALSFFTLTWSFDVKGTITSIITVVPFKDKQTINEPYTSRITYNKTTSALQLRNLVKEDAGDYILYIVTEEGTSVSEQVSLEVLEPVTDVKIASSVPEPVEINSTVVLTCTAKGSSTYKWINGSNPVVADGTHVKLNANELTVSEVYRTDLRGPILCVAENALESGKSAPFTVNVSYGPGNTVLTQTPTDSFLKKGSNITFTCSATSDPPAQFQLMFNGVEISSLDTTTINNLEEKHSGSYTCVASNAKTKRFIASQVFTISVFEKVQKSSDETEANIGEDVFCLKYSPDRVGGGG